MVRKLCHFDNLSRQVNFKNQDHILLRHRDWSPDPTQIMYQNQNMFFYIHKIAFIPKYTDIIFVVFFFLAKSEIFTRQSVW